MSGAGARPSRPDLCGRVIAGRCNAMQLLKFGIGLWPDSLFYRRTV